MRHSFYTFTILSLLIQTTFAQTPEVPDWAWPGSATRVQVSPPPDFHRPDRTVYKSIGVFDGQSDIGSAVVPGSSSNDPVKNQYTIISAGYNVWYTRDEFRYLWKKMSGDVSLAADIDYPDSSGFYDRKAVLVIRQSLDDDSKQALVALHGDGMFHLAWRPEKGGCIKDMEYRIGSRGGLPGGKAPDDLVTNHAKRIGIEKHGDSFALFVSMNGEPMHQFGAPVKLNLDEPFYAGIGFCSHIPNKLDTAVLSNVILENSAGKVCTEFRSDSREMEKIEKAIRTCIGWAQNKDIASLYNVIANDSSYLEVDPDGTVIKGFEEFKKNERIWMNPNFKAIRYEIRDLKITLSKLGNTAWFFCILDDINEWKGKPANWINTRWTGVLEKRNGKWIVVQMHFSFPQDK
ncbi:MAG: nuclear transport factor 2 family protein [Bacteroidetes bacterium]|nr:nuclear transport factor 2 family protein [Bacteroidota bacterium]